jgi:hypothetical protein
VIGIGPISGIAERDKVTYKSKHKQIISGLNKSGVSKSTEGKRLDNKDDSNPVLKRPNTGS